MKVFPHYILWAAKQTIETLGLRLMFSLCETDLCPTVSQPIRSGGSFVLNDFFSAVIESVLRIGAGRNWKIKPLQDTAGECSMLRENSRYYLRHFKPCWVFATDTADLNRRSYQGPPIPMGCCGLASGLSTEWSRRSQRLPRNSNRGARGDRCHLRTCSRQASGHPSGLSAQIYLYPLALPTPRFGQMIHTQRTGRKPQLPERSRRCPSFAPTADAARTAPGLFQTGTPTAAWTSWLKLTTDALPQDKLGKLSAIPCLISSIRSADRAPGYCVLRRGQGLPPLSPRPFLR